MADTHRVTTPATAKAALLLQEKHSSSESYPSVSTQVNSQMECGNIDEKLVKQELSDVLCEDKSQRFSKLVDSAACSTIQEMTWQSETQEVIENGYNSSLKDVNYHISVNVSSAIEHNNELCLTNEKCQLQNVSTLLKHTQMPAKPVANKFTYDRIQTEETPEIPYMSGVCVSIANVDENARRLTSSRIEQQADNCHDCGSCFAEAGCLEHHERKHAVEGLHICDVCGAVFAQPNRLTCHKRKHTGDKPYKCDVCEASYTNNNSLIHHKRIHTGDKPYKCDVCGASFTQSCNLICHKRTHTGEKPYKCDDCGASFSQSSHLNRHKRKYAVDNIEHARKKSYTCDVCGEFFAKKCNLEYHRKAHTEDKPYKCDVCGASFAKVDKLTFHKRIHRIHKAEKPHSCDVCGESFTKDEQLKWHKRTHTGEKSDTCLYCTASLIHPLERDSTTCDDSGTSFVEASNLNAHDSKLSNVTIVARSLI